MEDLQARSGAPGATATTRLSDAPDRGPGAWRDTGLQGALLFAYPFLVYFALTRFGSAATAAVLVALAGLRALPGLVTRGAAADRAARWHVGGLLLLAFIAVATGQGRVALAWPVFVNVALLFVFANSLRQGDSVVEAIALRLEGTLSERKRAYCRTVTKVWCGFFALNAAVAAALAGFAPVSWWTVYNGAIAYVLIALLFAAEYGVRRQKFPTDTAGRTDWTRVAEKGSVLGLQIIWWVCRVLGRPAVRTLVRGVALYYVCSDPELRRVSREFQRRVGRRGTFGDTYRHVLRFSFCIVDRLFLLNGQTELFEIESHGDDLLRATLESGQGAILVGAHFGSFEALRARAQEDAFPLSIVGYFENAQRINALLASLGPELATRVIHVEPQGVSHMMKIRECIRAGELVGFLGDRMAPGAEGVRVPFLGAEVEFPTGAFAVAAALGCPVFVAFCTSDGANGYEIHCEPFGELASVSRADRPEVVRDAVARYARSLETRVLASPDNWFNFYDFFGPVPPGPADPKP